MILFIKLKILKMFTMVSKNPMANTKHANIKAGVTKITADLELVF
jgi:hypothetical protein